MSAWVRLALPLILLGLWVGLPFVPDPAWNLGFCHLAAVTLLLLLAALSCTARPVVRLDGAWLATVLCLLSLGGALLTGQERFPQTERLWMASTGLAHALFFLAALVLSPVREALSDDDEQRFHPEVAPVRQLRLQLTVLLLLLVLAQALAMLPQVRAGQRPSGSFGNPNILGATLAAAALAVAAFARWRPLALLPVSGVLVLILATGSRGALAATGVVLLLLGLRRGYRQVLFVLAALALVLVVVPNPLTERVLSLHSEHHFGRPFFWQVAATNIGESPFGIGPGMNKHVFPPLALDPQQPWLLHQRHAVGLTHNLLLTLTLEWGWLAGIAALGLAAAALLRLTRAVGRDALGQGAALGAAVLLAEAQVDGLEQNPLAFSLLLFLCACCWNRSAGRARGWALPGRAVALVLLLGAVLLGVLASERAGRDRALGAARDALAVHVLSTPGTAEEAAAVLAARPLLAAAQSAAPQDAAAHLLRFLFLEEQLRRALDAGQNDPALLAPWLAPAWDALARARALDPADPWLVRSAARFALRVHRRLGKDPASLTTYFEAMGQLLELDPLDVAARWELAQEAQRAGRPELMQWHCARLLTLEPDDALAWMALGVQRRMDGNLEGAAQALQRAVEAVYNCRIKRAIDDPSSRAYYDRILERVDLEALRRLQAQLRRELFG